MNFSFLYFLVVFLIKSKNFTYILYCVLKRESIFFLLLLTNSDLLISFLFSARELNLGFTIGKLLTKVMYLLFEL